MSCKHVKAFQVIRTLEFVEQIFLSEEAAQNYKPEDGNLSIRMVWVEIPKKKANPTTEVV